MSREYKSVSDSMSEGGPAFPGKVMNTSFAGITTRDYFAAKAFAAVIATLNGPVTSEENPGDFEYYATCAYKMADAMLEARK